MRTVTRIIMIPAGWVNIRNSAWIKAWITANIESSSTAKLTSNTDSGKATSWMMKWNAWMIARGKGPHLVRSQNNIISSRMLEMKRITARERKMREGMIMQVMMASSLIVASRTISWWFRDFTFYASSSDLPGAYSCGLTMFWSRIAVIQNLFFFWFKKYLLGKLSLFLVPKPQATVWWRSSYIYNVLL